jgi:hypothetical protein
VKPFVPCRKILQHVKYLYSVKEIIVGKIHGHFVLSLSCFATMCVCAGYCQIGLVDESGMIRTQTGTHNISVIVAVYGTPYAIPHCK